MMTTAEIKDIITRELPEIVQHDLEVRQMIIDLSRRHFADKAETESRFDRVLDELRRDREANERKWREWQKEDQERWAENQKKWEKSQKQDQERWAENQKKWEEWQIKSAEEKKESNEKWAENQKTIEHLFSKMGDIKAECKQDINSAFGAIGARWGFRSEAAFRNGLRAILEKSFAVEVLNYVDLDEAGEVFGRPDQIELDIIIKNGLLIICEIKSSLSKGDIYFFEKKARFYEKRHQRQAQRLIAISPMIDDKAKEAAQKSGVEIYGYAEAVKAE